MIYDHMCNKQGDCMYYDEEDEKTIEDIIEPYVETLEDARHWCEGLEDVVGDVASRFDGGLSAVLTSEEFERIYRHMEELSCALKKPKKLWI